MAVRRVLQSRAAGATLVAAWGLGVGLCLAATVVRPEHELRHPAVTASAGLTVGWIVLAWALMPGPWRFARLAWTLGLLTLVAHVLIAFGVAHGWSHGAAVDHVRAVGGFGGGIVVNYLFALVWLLDVGWWWANPAGYSCRPRWAAWATHGFLAFVVLNAAVVFGPPDRRWVYGVALGAVAVLWLRRPPWGRR